MSAFSKRRLSKTPIELITHPVPIPIGSYRETESTHRHRMYPNPIALSV